MILVEVEFPVVVFENEVVYGATELRNYNCWALAVRHNPIVPLIESRMKLEQRIGRILANVRR